jgi:hypothetical protein
MSLFEEYNYFNYQFPEPQSLGEKYNFCNGFMVFKLHLIINDKGELVRGRATPQIVSFPLAI